MKELEIFINLENFHKKNYTEEEIDNLICSFWDNLDMYTFEFYDENYEEIAVGLLHFLCFSLIHFKRFGSGTYRIGNKDYGSHITYDQYNHRKQLNLKLNKNNEFLIELFLIDDFDNERTYFKKINPLLIPKKLRLILEDTFATQDPQSFDLKDL